MEECLSRKKEKRGGGSAEYLIIPRDVAMANAQPAGVQRDIALPRHTAAFFSKDTAEAVYAFQGILSAKEKYMGGLSKAQV